MEPSTRGSDTGGGGGCHLYEGEAFGSLQLPSEPLVLRELDHAGHDSARLIHEWMRLMHAPLRQPWGVQGAGGAVCSDGLRQEEAHRHRI